MPASNHTPLSAVALIVAALATAACAHTPAPPANSSPPSGEGAQPSQTASATADRPDQAEPLAMPEGGFVRLSAAAGSLLCGVEPEGPNVVVLGCQGVTLKAMRVVIVKQETLLAQMLAQPGWSATTVRIGERDVDGALFRAAEPDNARTGIAVAGQHANPPLMLSCFGPASDATERRCRQVLAVLAVEGLPEGVHFAQPSLSLAGRALSVPAGCRLAGADRIVCAGAELHWRDAFGECRSTKAEQRAMFHAMLESVGKVDHAEVTCTALGQPAACDRWLLRTPNRAPAIVLVAGIGCDQPMAQCNFLNTTPETLPERYPTPCEQVFEGVPPR